MTAPTPNAELAYRVLDQIDAHPELHDQSWWFTITDCGTAACFAGWSCMLSGDQVLPKGDLPLHLLPVGYEVSYVGRSEGEHEYVFPRAQQLLGLTKSQAQDLFAARNTREDLGLLVAEIFGPRPCSNCPPGHDCERGNYATDIDLDNVAPNAGSAS